MNRISFVIAAVAMSVTSPAFAQGTKADYERAANLRRTTQDKVVGDSVSANWLEGGTRFWYRVERASGVIDFVLVDAVAGTRGPLFDSTRLASALQKETGKEVDSTRLPIDRIIAKGDGLLLMVRGDEHIWQWNDKAQQLAAAAPDDARAFQQAQTQRRGRGGAAARADGRDTAIVFQNHTKDKVKLFWLASDSERRAYAEIAPGAEYRQHTFAGHRWVVTDANGDDLQFVTGENEPTIAVIEAKADAKPQASRPAAPTTQGQTQPRRAGGASPDGKHRAVVRERNLYLVDDAGKETALTTDGTAADGYDGRVYWSPDSKRVIAMRGTPGDEHKVYYVESSPRDQVQPKLHSYDYLKPGDNVPQYWPHLFELASGHEFAINHDLCGNPYDIDDVRWKPDSSAFTFMYNQRGHQSLRLIEVNASTGAARAIIDESSPTFIDYSGKQYLHQMDKTDEAIWMSERDGWNDLYLYDTTTGKVKNQITQGNWVVRGVDRVDDDKRQIWFRAGGIRPDQDPYYVHYCRVNFDGTGLTILTEGDGTHSIDYSPNGKWFVDTWSRVDQPPVTELRRSDDGSLVMQLEKADWSALLATGWQPPERFVAKGRDGVTDIYGIILRPTNFDPAKKYPVIESIYAGPQDSFVPKNFRPYFGSQEIGELGFIMVHIDGMGTSNRSKAFHDICFKNLSDGGFPDRILWLKAAAAQHTEMDLSRVGIYGGSAGGQNALAAMLLHGDFYKAAVADSGCHDNRMDKIWWNEQWMGWPVGDEYAANSNVTLAPNLTGKLMLVMGEMDENVDPASTMQVANALIKADKDFDLLIVPGAGHGACETPYGRRRRQDFFVRNLLGVEPRATAIAQGPG